MEAESVATTIDGHLLDKIETFKYSSATITGDARSEDEIRIYEKELSTGVESFWHELSAVTRTLANLWGSTRLKIGKNKQNPTTKTVESYCDIDPSVYMVVKAGSWPECKKIFVCLLLDEVLPKIVGITWKERSVSMQWVENCWDAESVKNVTLGFYIIVCFSRL